MTETCQEYLYDLSLQAVTFVAGFSMCEQAKLVPKSGERLGRFGVLPQQTGEALRNLNGPEHIPQIMYRRMWRTIVPTSTAHLGTLPPIVTINKQSDTFTAGALSYSLAPLAKSLCPCGAFTIVHYLFAMILGHSCGVMASRTVGNCSGAIKRL